MERHQEKTRFTRSCFQATIPCAVSHITSKKEISDVNMLFDTYIKAQVDKKSYGTSSSNMPFNPRETIHYLSFLARKLDSEKNTEFLIENIHPLWLEKSSWKAYKYIYATCCSFLICLSGSWLFLFFIDNTLSIANSGLVYGSFFVCIIGFISYFLIYKNSNLEESLLVSGKYLNVYSLIFRLKVSGFFGVIIGLITGLAFTGILIFISPEYNVSNNGITDALFQEIIFNEQIISSKDKGLIEIIEKLTIIVFGLIFFDRQYGSDYSYKKLITPKK